MYKNIHNFNVTRATSMYRYVHFNPNLPANGSKWHAEFRLASDWYIIPSTLQKHTIIHTHAPIRRILIRQSTKLTKSDIPENTSKKSDIVIMLQPCYSLTHTHEIPILRVELTHTLHYTGNRGIASAQTHSIVPLYIDVVSSTGNTPNDLYCEWKTILKKREKMISKQRKKKE